MKYLYIYTIRCLSNKINIKNLYSLNKFNTSLKKIHKKDIFKTNKNNKYDNIDVHNIDYSNNFWELNKKY